MSRRSIFLESHAGLCNRLRALDSAILLSREMRRPLNLFWSANDHLNAGFLDLFEPIPGVNIVHEKTSLAWRLITLAKKYRNTIGKASESTAILISLEGKLNHQFHQMPGNIRLPHQFHEINRYEIIHIDSDHAWLYPEDFSYLRPIEPIQNRIESICDRLSQPTTGLHIRRGDHEIARRHSPLSGFEKAIARCLDTDPVLGFFLATDDVDIRNSLTSRFPGKICVQSVEPERTTQTGAETAVVDLFVLAQCDHIIGSYQSSFSETAAHLGKGSLELIDSPKDR